MPRIPPAKTIDGSLGVPVAIRKTLVRVPRNQIKANKATARITIPARTASWCPRK